MCYVFRGLAGKTPAFPGLLEVPLFYFRKFIFSQTAKRTYIIIGNLFPLCSGLDSAVRVSDGFIIDIRTWTFVLHNRFLCSFCWTCFLTTIVGSGIRLNCHILRSGLLPVKILYSTLSQHSEYAPNHPVTASETPPSGHVPGPSSREVP